MHRIDTPSRQKDKFGSGKDGFTKGDPQTGTPATEVSPDILDAMQEEICAVIEDLDSGGTLDKSKNNQLVTAIKDIFNKQKLSVTRSVFDAVGVQTFIVPDKVTKVRVTVVGGGGGGGSAVSSANYNAAAGGGGAGGISKKTITVSPGQSISVTIGAGGNGATQASPTAMSGGSSSFGEFCSATGGGAGNSSSALTTSSTSGAGGSGGIGSGGDENGVGAFGASGVSASPSVAGASVGYGPGGPSPFKFGRGGNGGSTTASNQTIAGSNGVSGIVIVEW